MTPVPVPEPPAPRPEPKSAPKPEPLPKPAPKPEPLPQDPIAEARRHWADHGWGAAADGMAAVTGVMRAQQILLTRVENVLKPFGLTFARFELLALLSFTATGALPMAKAGARLQVHPTSVTNAVDRLEQAGLATRKRHPTDGRTVLVEITPSGRELVSAAAAVLNDEVFSRPGFPADDLTALTDILTRFRRDAGDFRDGAGEDDADSRDGGSAGRTKQGENKRS